MNDKPLLCVIVTILVVLAAGIAYTIHGVTVTIPKENALAFAAWGKLTGRHDITFDEWKLLKDRRLLGQPPLKP